MSELVDKPDTAEVPPALDADEREELARLRAEVAELRARPPATPATPAPPAPAPRARRPVRWASVGAAVLLVLGCLALPLSLLAVWTHNQVADTDRFVATVSPVFADPSVQNAMSDRVTNEVFTRVDVEQIVNQAVDALAAQGLPPELVDRLRALAGPIADGAKSFVGGKVHELVASPQFIAAANRALAVSHQQIDTVLSGQSSAITIQGANAVLDLAPFIDAAKQQLVASGFELAGKIPEVHPTVDLFPASYLVRAQTAYATLDALATWLPWITLLLLAGGILLARRRRRALVGVGIGIMVAMLVVAVGLLVVRGLVINGVPEQAAAPAAATYDIVVRFLRVALRTLFVVGLLVAVGAFLAGPSPTAVQVRGVCTRAIAGLRRGRIASRLQDGPVGPWVHQHRGLLRALVVVLAVLIVLFLDRPTGLDVLAVAIGLVVALGVIEFLDQPRPAVTGPEAAGDSGAAAGEGDSAVPDGGAAAKPADRGDAALPDGGDAAVPDRGEPRVGATAMAEDGAAVTRAP